MGGRGLQHGLAMEGQIIPYMVKTAAETLTIFAHYEEYWFGAARGSINLTIMYFKVFTHSICLLLFLQGSVQHRFNVHIVIHDCYSGKYYS